MLSAIRRGLRTRATLQLEILALRHQLLVLTAGEPGSTAPIDRLREAPLGLALTAMERVAICAGDRQTGDSHRVAEKRVPTVSEVEESSSAGSAFSLARGHRPDPEDEFGESSMGSATHPGGIVEAGIRTFRIDGGEVHGRPSETALADVAHIPNEPREDPGFLRLLRGSDRVSSSVVCVRHPFA